MARDYVKREKPSSKGKSNSSEAGKKPLLPVLLILSAVIGFSYFLFSIKDNASDPVIETQQQEKPRLTKPTLKQMPKPVAQLEPEKTVLPEKPKVRLYIKELENKQVQVEMPELDTKPSKPYLMQCGSFRRQADAETLKAKIAFLGLEATVRSSEGKKGLWHRVILGPFVTKRDAEAARHRLSRGSINGCAIWFW